MNDAPPSKTDAAILVPPWLIRRHKEALVLSCLAIAMMLLLQVDDGERVSLCGFENHPLPPLCMSRAWFGVECPACGLTRSMVLFAHGRIAESFALHRLGWLLAILIAFQIPYRIAALRWPAYRIIPHRLSRALLYGIVVMVLGNWVLKFFY
jgi:hypothetical protein